MSQMEKIGAHHTTITRDREQNLVVHYHNTDVVTVRPSGEIILNTGGWRTVTTKRRMNQASAALGLGFTVYQEAGEWFVKIAPNETLRFEGQTIAFIPMSRL